MGRRLSYKQIHQEAFSARVKDVIEKGKQSINSDCALKEYPKDFERFVDIQTEHCLHYAPSRVGSSAEQPEALRRDPVLRTDIDRMRLVPGVLAVEEDDQYVLGASDCRLLVIQHTPGEIGSVTLRHFDSSSKQYHEPYCLKRSTEIPGVKNGPAVRTTGYDHTGNSFFVRHDIPVDLVDAIPCKSWPKKAAEWAKRERKYHWPSDNLINSILEDVCCHLVRYDKCRRIDHIGPTSHFRYSFSVAECRLIRSWTKAQHFVYNVLRLMKYELIHRPWCTPESLQFMEDFVMLKTYYIKTVLLWMAEEQPIIMDWPEDDKLSEEQRKLLADYIAMAIERIVECLHRLELKNYFMPDWNILRDLKIRLQATAFAKVEIEAEIILLNSFKDKIYSFIEICLNTFTGKIEELGIITDYCKGRTMKLRSLLDYHDRHKYKDEIRTLIKSELREIYDNLCAARLKGCRAAITSKQQQSSHVEGPLPMLKRDGWIYHECILDCYDLTKKPKEDNITKMEEALKKDCPRDLDEDIHRRIHHMPFSTDRISNEISLIYLANFCYKVGNYHKAKRICESILNNSSQSDELVVILSEDWIKLFDQEIERAFHEECGIVSMKFITLSPRVFAKYLIARCEERKGKLDSARIYAARFVKSIKDNYARDQDLPKGSLLLWKILAEKGFVDGPEEQDEPQSSYFIKFIELCGNIFLGLLALILVIFAILPLKLFPTLRHKLYDRIAGKMPSVIEYVGEQTCRRGRLYVVQRIFIETEDAGSYVVERGAHYAPIVSKKVKKKFVDYIPAIPRSSFWQPFKFLPIKYMQ